MADPRFYSTGKPIKLEKLAEVAEARIGDGADPEAEFIDVQPLSVAGPKHVSFLDNRKYIDSFAESRAGACLVHPDHAARAPEGMALLLTEEPYRAYTRVAGAFYPPPAVKEQTAQSAFVDKTAKIGKGCRIDPGAFIGAKAEIGKNCHIGANATVGDGVVLGDDCTVGSGASVTHCIAGNRVIVQAGAQIGQDGFGFAPGPDQHLKVPQLGRVVIEDDVDIGANTTIDRGSGPDTVVGEGTKIDNLVQIAHNVKIGKHCLIVSQVGISGSTEIGDFVMIGGQTGLAGHLRIGDGVRIAGKSGVMRDIEAGAAVGGTPTQPMREWLRSVAVFIRLAKKTGK